MKETKTRARDHQDVPNGKTTWSSRPEKGESLHAVDLM